MKLQIQVTSGEKARRHKQIVKMCFFEGIARCPMRLCHRSCILLLQLESETENTFSKTTPKRKRLDDPISVEKSFLKIF